MTERKNPLAALFAACWKDEALKARFLADPKAVLVEHGLSVPDGIEVKAVENTDDRVHITLPAPPADHGDLSDEALGQAAGGAIAIIDNASGDAGILGFAKPTTETTLPTIGWKT